MRDYKINKETLAILPIDEYRTKVYENDNVIIIERNIQKIIEENCEYYGSSYAGRKRATSDLIGITHKPPIIIEDSKELIFFPTTSPRLKTCSWISLSHIESYKAYERYSVIKFNNNLVIKLPISQKILNNQILRATRLESVHHKRKNDLVENIEND